MIRKAAPETVQPFLPVRLMMGVMYYDKSLVECINYKVCDEVETQYFASFFMSEL